MSFSAKKLLLYGFVGGLAVGMVVTTLAATSMGSALFADVQPGSYFDAAVGRLNAANIIKGMPDGMFHGEQAITRADMAVVIDRLMTYLNGGVTVSGATSSSRSVGSTSSMATVGAAGGFHFTTTGFNVGGAATTATVNVIRSGGNRGIAKVDYSFGGGTAVSGTDYTASAGTLVFADGETSKNISVNLIRSATQPTKTLVVTLSNPTNSAVLSTPFTATVTIIGNGAAAISSASAGSSASAVSGAGTFSFSAQTYGVMENGGSATITVVRSDGTNGTVAVNYATGDKTATAGTHYASAQGTLTFNQGDMSKTFTVHAIDNATLDGNKTANLTLSSPTGGAALGSIATSTLTFIDDESAPSGTGSVQFTASTFTASRSANANALITVSRTGNPAVNVSVNYAVLDGTAIANGDYKATSGTLTFAPNETTKFFLVPLVKGTPHGESTASLLLTNVSGSTFGPQTTATLKLED